MSFLTRRRLFFSLFHQRPLLLARCRLSRDRRVRDRATFSDLVTVFPSSASTFYLFGRRILPVRCRVSASQLRHFWDQQRLSQAWRRVFLSKQYCSQLGSNSTQHNFLYFGSDFFWQCGDLTCLVLRFSGPAGKRI